MGEASDRRQKGYEKARDLLWQLVTDDGFLASTVARDNYRRIWARDGVIIGLAALMTDMDALVDTMRKTLKTLADHQGEHGEIPSNVDTTTHRISYGGTTGRVDADLWFVIGCTEYWLATGDEGFLAEMLPALERVRFLLGAWEFNDRGLIYVPQTGDWADEYLQTGYILYDQLLYLQASRCFCRIHHHVHGSADHRLEDRTIRLCHLIRSNYWFNGTEPEDVYHEVLYRKGQQASPRRGSRYWMPFFSPTGYGYRFDAFANVLAGHFGVADAGQAEQVDRYIRDITPDKLSLLPAFHPVIEPIDRDWEHLQMMFSYSFKNNPYEFHNGGLWPMITGFYVADLVARGHPVKAREYLDGIHEANALAMNDEPWSFPEFVHGKKLNAGGNRCQGWSAAAAVMAHHAIAGEPVMRALEPTT